MKRIAFCWELGSGSGHLTGLLEVADPFVDQGHACAFAVPDPAAILRHRPQWAERSNIQSWKSPNWDLKAPSAIANQRTHTFADVLEPFGFTNRKLVSERVMEWSHRLGEFRPDSVVTEFAPGALIASRDRFRCVVFGNGYYVLPNLERMPSMTAWDPDVPESSREAEQNVISSIAFARGLLGLKSWERLCDAFRGDETFVCTFASLDPYRTVRNEITYVPFNIPIPKRLPIPQQPKRGFVYFSFPHAVVEKMLTMVLSQRDFPCVIYAPPYSRQLMPYRGTNGHEIIDEPMDLRQLPEFAFCIHHGGMGISSSLAIAGRPQFITPVNLEHAITANALCGQKAAIMCLPETVLAWQSPLPLVHAIQAVLSLPIQLEPEFNVEETIAAKTLAEIRSRC
jgi:hypothetical protein